MYEDTYIINILEVLHTILTIPDDRSGVEHSSSIPRKGGHSPKFSLESILGHYSQ